MSSTTLASQALDHSIREIVARNIHAARQNRGLTLNGLSEMSGIGKATLSGIENQAGNPTIETVWQLAKALDVPFGQLVEGEGNKRTVVSKGVTATLIDNQTAPQNIETYLLEIAPHTTHKAEAHMLDVKEHIVALRGHVLVGDEVAPAYLRPGQTHSFAADTRHIYRSLDQAVTAIVTVVYPIAQKGRLSLFDQARAWPHTDDEWLGLHLQVARLKLEVSQGIEAARLSFDACELAKPEILSRLGSVIVDDSDFQSSVQTFALIDVQPVLLILARPHTPHLLQSAPAASPSLQAAVALSNRANSLWKALEDDEIKKLNQELQHGDNVIAALAAEVLTRHGRPSVPARIKPKQVGEKVKRSSLDDGVSFEDRIDVDAYAAYELVHPAYARQSVAIANHLAFHCQSGEHRLLDVGTGPGLPLQMLLELNPALQATAVDPSTVAFQHLCRLFKDDKRVTPMQASITDIAFATDRRFDVAVSVGASHHLNTSHFLQATHRQLKPGALFLVADEMIAPFSNGGERNANLIAHHLQYVVDTMVDLPRNVLSEAELVLVDLVRQHAPLAIFEARSGNVAPAANRCRVLLKNLHKLCLPEPISHELLAFYRFHLLELEALVAGLDYEVEQKTYPQRFAELAQHAGFEVCTHSRLYATHGVSEWDGGTHLFVLKALA
ncbi:MAG: helix-turn-helix domain-containing protein [Burkholderiales bacterium]|nr:helix-turn-helix domain-containing protein [Burkholderiales bacterium]